MVAVGIERDIEISIGAAQQVFEPRQLRSTEAEVRTGEHLDLDAKSGGLIHSDRSGVVGTGIVDQQHIDVDTRPAQDRRCLFDLGQHGPDGGAAVVRGKHDREFWHRVNVPAEICPTQAAGLSWAREDVVASGIDQVEPALACADERKGRQGLGAPAVPSMWWPAGTQFGWSRRLSDVGRVAAG